MADWTQEQLEVVYAVSLMKVNGEKLTIDEEMVLAEYCWTELVDLMIEEGVPHSEITAMLEKYISTDGIREWGINIIAEKNSDAILGYELVDLEGRLLYEPAE